MTGDLHIDGRYESACRTYGSDGVSPALPTAGGGGIVPKIEVAGSLGDGYIANNNVYSPDGIAPTHRANAHGNDLKIEVVGDLHLEKLTGGKRNNHSNMVMGIGGVSECLTNAMGSGGGHAPKIEIVGEIADSGKMAQKNAVFDSNGISPAHLSTGYKDQVKIEVDTAESKKR